MCFLKFLFCGDFEIAYITRSRINTFAYVNGKCCDEFYICFQLVHVSTRNDFFFFNFGSVDWFCFVVEGELVKDWARFPPLKKPFDNMTFMEMRGLATSILRFILFWAKFEEKTYKTLNFSLIFYHTSYSNCSLLSINLI